jgi:hypothetical protein
LIINELGAGVAGRSGDLQAAHKRAVPAIDQTDRLLNVLSNDSATIEDLTHNANAVITDLANNSANVARFITEANNAASDTATQQENLRQTFQNLPAFLEQLKPSLRKLGNATDANLPVLENLNAAAPQFTRLLTDLPAFSHSALPALRSLGQASVTGRTAVIAARPTIHHLNQFSTHTPELAQNLAIVLHDLDDRHRAVETDARSPGGQGYTGLEALLQYAFNQVLALDYYGPFGHTLALDLNVSPMCSPYQSPATVAMGLKAYGATYRNCYGWLGPNQPGINETDPTDPSAKVPDPGGAPPGLSGPQTSAQKLTVADVARADHTTQAALMQHTVTGSTTTPATSAGSATPATPTTSGAAPSANTPAPNTTTSTPPAGSAPTTPQGPAIDLGKTIQQVLGLFGGGSDKANANSKTGTASSDTNNPSGTATTPTNQTQQLLQYLLNP